MFDLGASELLLCAIVAILVIGPKELPAALRTAGKWVAKWRNMTKHFRTGLDAMIREAELEEMEREFAERNARIMKEHPPENSADVAKPKIIDAPDKPEIAQGEDKPALPDAAGGVMEPLAVKSDAPVEHAPREKEPLPVPVVRDNADPAGKGA